MSAIQLRDAMLEKIGPDLIGVYTLSNNERTPAIYCTSQGDSSTNDRRCQGVEVVILNSGTKRYVLYIKNWDSLNNRSNVDQIINKIERYFTIAEREEIKIKEQPLLKMMIKLTIDTDQYFEYDETFLD
jgi:hypothetical protein